jgi:hypothetical protein
MADQPRRPAVGVKQCEWWLCGSACRCEQTIIELEEVIDASHATTNLHRWGQVIMRPHSARLLLWRSPSACHQRPGGSVSDSIHPASRSAARLHAMLQQDHTHCPRRRCAKRRQGKPPNGSKSENSGRRHADMRTRHTLVRRQTIRTMSRREETDAALHQLRQAMQTRVLKSVLYELDVTDNWLQGRRMAGRRILTHRSDEQSSPCQAFLIVGHLQPASRQTWVVSSVVESQFMAFHIMRGAFRCQ